MALRVLLYTMTKVNTWLLSPSGKAADVPEELRTDVAAALQSAMETYAKMGRPKRERGEVVQAGRPPSTVYIIDVSNHAPKLVAGQQAAADAVNKWMGDLHEKRRFTTGNLSVSIARNGEWFHNVETTNGTITISVRKADEKTTAQFLLKIKAGVETGT